MKNHYVFLIFPILFTNCQKETIDKESIEQIQSNNELLEVRKISISEAYELEPIFQMLKKVENKSSKNKSNNTNGIEIIGEEGTLVSDGTDDFYTFQITRDTSAPMENLIIKVQYGAKEKQYTSYIASYDLSLFDKVSLEKGENIDLASKMRIQPIVLDNVSSLISQRPTERCFEIIEVTEKSRATGWDITVYKIIEATCPESGGGNEEGNLGNFPGDGFGDPFQEGNFGGGAGNEPGSPGPNSPEEIDFNAVDIYTAPTLRLNIIGELGELLQLGPHTSPQMQYLLYEASIDEVVGISNFIEEEQRSTEAKEFAKAAIDALNDGAAVDFANKIIKDPTFVGTKADCVLNSLISSNNNLFKKTSQAFTDQNSKFKIKFTAVNDATDIADARTSLPDDNGIIEIRINLALVANSNALDLARMIFHETIHAELHRIKLSNNAGPNPLPQDQYNWYADMWERYEGFYNGNQNDTASAAEHYYMSVYFIDNIAKGLRQFDNNTHPLANYKYFAWEGLENYGTQNGYITSAELSALANLTTIVHNDGHTNPCD